MLEMRNANDVTYHQIGWPTGEPYDWRWMVRAGLRHLWLIVAGGLLCAILATAYVALRPSHYTASAVLNITNLRLSTSGEDAFFTEAQFDPTFLETQIETIGSTPVLTSVIQTQRLAEDGNQQRALKKLRSGLAIQRLGQSNLVEIRYTSGNPEQAAAVANDVARAYMAKQEADRNEAVQSASGWLRDRLREAGPKAQVMSAATPPVDKSDPRGLAIIAIAGILGGAIGFVAALASTLLDRTFRRPEQLAIATKVECFGTVPTLEKGDAISRLWEVSSRVGQPEWQALRLASVSLLSLGRPSARIVGVTSVRPSEGKTLLAANLARQMATLGKKVLLVDAQAYKPDLSKLIDKASVPGLVHYVEARDMDMSQLILRNVQPGVDVMPFGQARGGVPMIWSARMAQFMEAVEAYDLVVLDLPSLEAAADLRAADPFIDAFVLIVEARRTADESVTTALSAMPSLREKFVGSFLNRCDPEPAIGWLPPFLR